MLTIRQKRKRKWSEAGRQLRLLYLNTSLGAFQIAGGFLGGAAFGKRLFPGGDRICGKCVPCGEPSV